MEDPTSRKEREKWGTQFIGAGDMATRQVSLFFFGGYPEPRFSEGDRRLHIRGARLTIYQYASRHKGHRNIVEVMLQCYRHGCGHVKLEMRCSEALSVVHAAANPIAEHRQFPNVEG